MRAASGGSGRPPGAARSITRRAPGSGSPATAGRRRVSISTSNCATTRRPRSPRCAPTACRSLCCPATTRLACGTSGRGWRSTRAMARCRPRPSAPRCARRRRPARSSRWSATASTTPPCSRRPIVARDGRRRARRARQCGCRAAVELAGRRGCGAAAGAPHDARHSAEHALGRGLQRRLRAARAGGLLPPWAAGLGMAASSLFVVLNSLRLAEVARMDILYLLIPLSAVLALAILGVFCLGAARRPVRRPRGGRRGHSGTGLRND